MCSVVGATIITEQFMSCIAMKDVQDLEKERNKPAEEVQELRKQFPQNKRASHMMNNQNFVTPQLLLSLAAKLLFVEVAQQFIEEMTKIRLKTAVKKSAMVRFCNSTHTFNLT